MSQYREGRKESHVVQTWLNQYKEKVMNEVVYKDREKELLSERETDILFNGTPETAEFVTDIMMVWLNSELGREFVSEAFHIEVSKDANPISLWFTTYKQTILETIIHRVGNWEKMPKETLKAIDEGTPETAEIVADTIIGWLNSPVGREFITEAFKVRIPIAANNGSEFVQ